MGKVITAEQAAALVKNGQRLMIGGFGDTGQPSTLIRALADTDVMELTTISNDGGRPEDIKGQFMVSGKVKKMIVTFIGLNPKVSDRYNEGNIQLHFVPQGNFVEGIRAAGYGLGGVLTKVGKGTVIEEGHKTIDTDEGEFLLQEPIPGDIAFIYGDMVDEYGNVYCKYSEHNYQLYMAMAAKTVIVEARHIINYGEADVNTVSIPGILVDHVVADERMLNGGETCQ